MVALTAKERKKIRTKAHTGKRKTLPLLRLSHASRPGRDSLRSRIEELCQNSASCLSPFAGPKSRIFTLVLGDLHMETRLTP